jgi:hypothetical protein
VARTVRTIALLSLILAMAGVAPPRGSVAGSQAPQQPAPRFRTGVDVVEVAVLVRDREGKPITDLTRDEITVLENGTPQALVAFEKVSLPVRAAEVPQRAVQVPLDVASNRIQAVVLRGDGRKSDVRLVVEVLGRALRFDEQGGRFNERLELALMTVNDGGRASNGTSINIDLRLTPEDLGRVRGTGVRWLSALELPPGRHQLRVAGRAAGTGISGMITHDIVVPAARRNGLEMSGVTLTSAPSVLMITKGKPWLDQALPTPPTAARTFVAGDQIVAAVEVYRQGSAAAAATLVARIDRRDGSPSGFEDRRVVQATGPGSEQVGFPISTAKLPPGRYVLRVTLEAPGAEPLERAVPFEVVGR